MSSLGGPFDEYGRRLVAADDATRQVMATALGDDYGAAVAAEIDLADARDAVTAFEMDRANEWLMGARLALKWYPADVVQMLDRVEQMRAEWEEEAEQYAAKWTADEVRDTKRIRG